MELHAVPNEGPVTTEMMVTSNLKLFENLMNFSGPHFCCYKNKAIIFEWGPSIFVEKYKIMFNDNVSPARAS